MYFGWLFMFVWFLDCESFSDPIFYKLQFGTSLKRLVSKTDETRFVQSEGAKIRILINY